MAPGGGFTVLLLIGGLSSVIAAVPTPQKPNVSCQNLKTTVSWDYDEGQPQSSFTVALRGSERHFEGNTTDHQYDLSHFIWESEQQYMGFHYVTVTAIQGGNTSEGVNSNSFSFNHLKTASLKCDLDFPPVNLTVGDSGATVTFQNPLHFYKELKEAVKDESASLEFSVSPGGESPQTCNVMQNICRYDVQFPEDGQKCFKLKGRLCNNKCLGWVVFKETEICASNSAEIHVITLVLLLCIFVLAITVLSVLICKVKAWTMKLPNLPASLVLKDSDLLNPKQHLKYNTVPNFPISPITVTSLDTHKSCSVSSEDSSTSLDLQASCPGLFYTERGPSDGSDQELDAPEFSERHRIDDSSVDSMKTEIVLIEEEEEEEISPYEPRIRQIDMGDGDMVDCYSSR